MSRALLEQSGADGSSLDVLSTVRAIAPSLDKADVKALVIPHLEQVLMKLTISLY